MKDIKTGLLTKLREREKSKNQNKTFKTSLLSPNSFFSFSQVTYKDKTWNFRSVYYL